MTHYFILNEFNLARLLWLSLRGRRVVVLQNWPLVSASNRVLHRVVGWLRKRNRLEDKFRHLPGWDRFDIPQGGPEAYGYYTDAFMKIESWHDRYFNFADLDRRLPDYAQASRHRIASHYPDIHWLIFALVDLCDRDDAILVGSFPELTGAFAAYHGREFPTARCRPAIEMRSLLNFALCGIAIIYTVAWALRRTVGRPPQPVHHPVATELLQVYRHLTFNREMVERDEDCLAVFRTPWFRETYKGRIGRMPHCLHTDGFVPLSALPSTAALAVGDVFRLYRNFHRLQPSLFRRLTSLVYWRIVYRALLRRYPCDFFLGRDDYNGQHAIRSQELRRIGATSLGIAHGLPTTNTVHPVVRYLDFDIYYGFGTDLYHRYYKQTYAPTMRYRAIGSIGMNREQLGRIDLPRPKNIIVYISDDMERAEIIETMHRLAAAFPDRKVIVKIKESQFDHGCAQPFVDAIAAGPDNLVDERRDSFEIMLEARYAISNDSTIVAEAIFYGLATFVLDAYSEVMPERHPMIFRDYPDLCQATAADIIQRIRDIEAGRWAYPIESFVGLAGDNTQNPFDVVRRDLGLAPKSPGTALPRRASA